MIVSFINSIDSCCGLGSDWAETGKSCDGFNVSSTFDGDEDGLVMIDVNDEDGDDGQPLMGMRMAMMVNC